MNFIRLYKKGEGCAVPNGDNYLLVFARELDANGDWLPTEAQSFETWHELQTALREMLESGEGIIVQASPHFERLANELGLTLLRSEWGEKRWK